MSDRKLSFASASALSMTNIASLATSSTWTVGREIVCLDNSSNLYLDALVGGHIQSGTTPTANTIIEVWPIPLLADGNWPDVFAGADAARTVTTRAILLDIGSQPYPIAVDSNTSNRNYPFQFSVLALMGWMPKQFSLFVTHNTGVNLNATAGNHSISVMGQYETIL